MIGSGIREADITDQTDSTDRFRISVENRIILKSAQIIDLVSDIQDPGSVISIYHH